MTIYILDGYKKRNWGRSSYLEKSIFLPFKIKLALSASVRTSSSARFCPNWPIWTWRMCPLMFNLIFLVRWIQDVYILLHKSFHVNWCPGRNDGSSWFERILCRKSKSIIPRLNSVNFRDFLNLEFLLRNGHLRQKHNYFHTL